MCVCVVVVVEMVFLFCKKPCQSESLSSKREAFRTKERVVSHTGKNIDFIRLKESTTEVDLRL